MKTEQFSGLAREIIFALLALVVSFNFLPSSNVDTIGAAALAVVVLIWGIIVKPQGGAAIGSFIRKAVQAVPPVLVVYEVVTPEQSMTITALLLAIVGTWSFKAKA